MLSFKQFLQEQSVHTQNGWEILITNHAELRNAQRTNGISDEQWTKFGDSVITRCERSADIRNGEYLFVSKSLNQAVVFNVDKKVKQLRYITILPRGKQIPKQGTSKIMVESVEYVIIWI